MKTGWLAGVLFLVAMIPAQAQQVDSRWAPWLGCWQLVDESIRQTATADDARDIAQDVLDELSDFQSAADGLFAVQIETYRLAV